MGEVGGRAPSGFDFGNSPFEVSGIDFTGKSIVQRTSAGTQGIVAAGRAERLYATSLVTASATARALLSSASSRISLVAMGNNATVRTDEDELCALHLRNLLEGRRGDSRAVCQVIMARRRCSAFPRSRSTVSGSARSGYRARRRQIQLRDQSNAGKRQACSPHRGGRLRRPRVAGGLIVAQRDRAFRLPRIATLIGTAEAKPTPPRPTAVCATARATPASLPV